MTAHRHLLEKHSLSVASPRCELCGDPITQTGDFLILNSRWDVQGSRFGEELPLAFFAHGNCADEIDPMQVLYGVELSRIPNATSGNGWGDCLTGWQKHLKSKLWITPEMLDALAVAHAVARSVNAPQRPEKAQPELRLVRDARAKVNAKLRLKIFARDGHVCKKCGAAPPLELDHVIPVSKGGSSEPANLQSLCVKCNRAKRDHVEALA